MYQDTAILKVMPKTQCSTGTTVLHQYNSAAPVQKCCTATTVQNQYNSTKSLPKYCTGTTVQHQYYSSKVILGRMIVCKMDIVI